MFNLKPIQSAHEAVIVGTSGIAATELIDAVNLDAMGENAELIKLGLQAIIAVATVIKTIRTNRNTKKSKEQNI